MKKRPTPKTPKKPKPAATKRPARSPLDRAAGQGFETMVAQTPLIIFGLDPKGRFTFSAGRGLDALNLGAHEVVGRSALDMYRDLPLVVAELQRALRGEEFSSLVQVGQLWFETYYHPVFAPDGKLSTVVGMALNVTMRQRAEDDLLKSELRFRTVIDTMQEGFYLTDAQGKRLFVNKALARIYGKQEPEDLLGQSFLDRVAPEMREGIKARFQEAMRTGVFTRRVEVEFLRDDGSRGVMELDPAPVLEDGQLKGACGVVRDITERRQAETALRLTQFAVDRCSMPIYWVARDARLVYVNEAACQSLGYTREELLRLTIHDMDQDFPASRWTQHWEDCRRAGTLHLQSRHRAKDGRLIPVEVTVNHMEFAGQEYHFSFVLDISERMRAETRVRESQDMLRLVLDNIPQRVFWKDRGSVILGCNRPLAQDLGLAGPGQLVGKTDADLPVPAESAQRSLAGDREVMETGAPKLNYEERVVRPDGSKAWLRVSKLPLRGPDDQVIGILGTYEDVTDRKEADRALRLMHFATEHSADAVFWLDRDGRFRYANRAFCEHLGYHGNELVKLALHDVEPDLGPQAWGQHWARMKKEGYLLFETNHRAKSGRLIPVEVSSNYVDFEGEEFLFCYARDISERKGFETERARLLEQEREARAQAEAASRAKDEFLAIVSHELRTPITAILGWNWLLRSGELSAAERERALDVIERNMQLQRQIIEDLLDVSSLVRRQLSLRKRIVDLGGVVAEAASSLQAAAQAQSLRLVCRSVPGLSVAGDPERLRQIFWNLVSNAVKFTPPGGTVSVLMRQEAGKAEVIVEDTGPGISPEFYPHLFELFRQQEDSLTRVHRGLGLGLAIVKHLVELHGGSASVDPPVPGQGARVRVTLPLIAPEPGAEAAAPAAEARQAPAAGVLRGLRVLIVDDKHDTRITLSAILEQCGAQTQSAASANEAFASFQQCRPDVVLCDIVMPGESGYSLLRRIRALPPAEGGLVPIAALTAYASDKDRGEALRSGFQTYLIKPADPAEIVAVVRSLAPKKGPETERT